MRQQTGGTPCARPTRDTASHSRGRWVGVSELWGRRIRKGGRGAEGGGPVRGPAHVPRSDPQGEGQFPLGAGGSEGRELRGGGGRLSPSSLTARAWGGGSGSAQIPSLAFDQLVPEPRARGKGSTGRGGDTWAVAPRLGGGGGGRSPRAPESGIRGGVRDARPERTPRVPPAERRGRAGGAAGGTLEPLTLGTGGAQWPRVDLPWNAGVPQGWAGGGRRSFWGA